VIDATIGTNGTGTRSPMCASGAQPPFRVTMAPAIAVVPALEIWVIPALTWTLPALIWTSVGVDQDADGGRAEKDARVSDADRVQALRARRLRAGNADGIASRLREHRVSHLSAFA